MEKSILLYRLIKINLPLTSFHIIIDGKVFSHLRR